MRSEAVRFTPSFLSYTKKTAVNIDDPGGFGAGNSQKTLENAAFGLVLGSFRDPDRPLDGPHHLLLVAHAPLEVPRAPDEQGAEVARLGLGQGIPQPI